MTKEENELLPGRTPQSPAATTSRKGYERIFDFIPPISLYQIGLVCCALYPRIAAGAIQFGSIVLEATPQNVTCIETECSIKMASADDINLLGGGNAQCFNYEQMNVKTGCPINTANRCTKYLYEDDIFTDTVRTEFNLFCDRSYMVSHMGTVQFGGLMVGSISFGFMGDVLGRKLSILISCLGASVSMLFVYFFSFNAAWYTFFRLLSLIFIAGSVPVTLVYAVEFVGTRYRSYVSGAGYIIFDMGLAFLSVLPLIVSGWRYQVILISMLPLLFVISYFILPKSMQFLYSKGRIAEADAVLEATLKKTEADLSNMSLLSDHLVNVCQPKQSGDKLSMRNLFDSVFASYTLRISIMFLVSCMCNFYMVLSVDELTGNTLQNNAIMAGFDAAGYLLLGFSLNTFGRIRHLTVTFVCSGLLVVISSIIQYYSDTSDATVVTICNALVFFGKMCNSMNFGAMFTYATEIYPTSIRTTGLGFTASMSRLGGMLAPQLSLLTTTDKRLPYAIIGLLSMIAAAITTTLPETKGRALIQTKSEAIEFYAKSRQPR